MRSKLFSFYHSPPDTRNSQLERSELQMSMILNENYYFVYVLKSKKDNNLYIGYTKELNKRLSLHNQGEVDSTKGRLPMDLVYFEACLNQKDALDREKYLKSTYGRRFLKNRLKYYFKDK